MRMFICIMVFALNGCMTLNTNNPEIAVDTLVYPEKTIKIKYNYNNNLESEAIVGYVYKYEMPQSYKTVEFIKYYDVIPSTGYYVEIDVRRNGLSNRYGSTYHRICQWTLFIIPFFYTSDISVSYRLFSNGKVTSLYNYVVNEGVMMWLPLLPLAWINQFTNGFEDAVDKTLYQFINDSYLERKLMFLSKTPNTTNSNNY